LLHFPTGCSAGGVGTPLSARIGFGSVHFVGFRFAWSPDAAAAAAAALPPLVAAPAALLMLGFPQ